jgi:hypothetical protein
VAELDRVSFNQNSASNDHSPWNWAYTYLKRCVCMTAAHAVCVVVITIKTGRMVGLIGATIMGTGGTGPPPKFFIQVRDHLYTGPQNFSVKPLKVNVVTRPT